MKQLKTISFIQSHQFWRDLLTNPPYNLILTEDEHYIMLRYNHCESDMSLDICQECRGLVIDKHTLQPVALSFYKFFNYGEPYAHTISWKTAKVLEKIDGSKILVFFDRYTNMWKICTSGTLDAYKTPVGGYEFSFGSLFEEAVQNLKIQNFQMFGDLLLDRNKHYTFELVSKYNRIVVPYEKTMIYQIGCRDNHTFEEETPNLHFVPKPKEYPLCSVQDCLEAVSKMGYDEEGFVVVDAKWNRVKIKSPEYVMAAHVKGNGITSPTQIFNLIMNGEEWEFRSYFPEYNQDFEEIHEKINCWEISAQRAIRWMMSEKFDTQKDFALWVKENIPEFKSMLFDFNNHISKWVKLYLKRMTKENKLAAIGIKENKGDKND